MGFNPGSFLNAIGVNFADVAVNTNLAAAAGIIGATVGSLIMFRTLDVSQMGNGAIAGLVAITAPCAFTSPMWSALIGAIAGVLVVFAVSFVENVLKIDDPVGAISVHGICGSFGVLAVGIFANGSYGGAWNGSDVTAVEGVVNGKFGQLGAQALGVLVIWTVILGVAWGFFALQNKLTKGGIRSTEEHELMGLDLPEMGVLAYPEFMGSHTSHGETPFSGSGVEDPIPAEV
jgi:Amt family ammonium transporter